MKNVSLKLSSLSQKNLNCLLPLSGLIQKEESLYWWPTPSQRKCGKIAHLRNVAVIKDDDSVRLKLSTSPPKPIQKWICHLFLLRVNSSSICQVPSPLFDLHYTSGGWYSISHISFQEEECLFKTLFNWVGTKMWYNVETGEKRSRRKVRLQMFVHSLFFYIFTQYGLGCFKKHKVSQIKFFFWYVLWL